MVRLSRAASSVEPYPFEELDRRKAERLGVGAELIDFGVGDPRGETAPFIRRALADAIAPVSSYPRAAGLPELRGAIAAWIARRFEVSLDPELDVLPLLGSKELIFSLASLLVDPGVDDLVLVTAPGYGVPERGARYAGAEVTRLPLAESDGFLPDLDAIDADTWSRARLLWLNYPNNPTGAVAPLSFLRHAAERCREHDVVLAADEAYTELWFEGGPPASALQTGELSNVVAINTLSKRSSMTGYRSGFVAGDRTVIDALKRLRPATGVTPQELVQRASIAAWSDEDHVVANRASYAEKRGVLAAALDELGIRVAGSMAGMYLWVEVPGGRPSLDWTLELLDAGVMVAPGSFFGPEGEGFVRMALVPSLDDHLRAADLLRDALGPNAAAARTDRSRAGQDSNLRPAD